MGALGVIALTFIALIGLGLAEGIGHWKNLRRIPTRIHVNGTRGKSSVTRLIAAGLRAGGLRTCAKTTGTLARMILPNGKEYPVFRPSRPNVIEQLRIVRTAAEQGAQVLVIECMAVQPHLQSLSEQKLVRSTHGVITNARPDHLDVMGPSEEDVALALAATTPVAGTLFTAERRYLGAFTDSARDRGTKLVAVTEEEIAAVSKDDLDGFTYLEHAENVALALSVCQGMGVDRKTALEGMWRGSPDPGVLTAHALDFFGRRIVFVNAFAANDPDSTGRIWKMVVEKYPAVEKRLVLVNCRADRPDRSRQLGEACGQWSLADHYLLIGTGTYIFAKAAIASGLDPARMSFAEDRRIEEIFELVVDLSGRASLVVGIANIGGQGLDLVRYFRNRSAELPPVRSS